MLLKLLSSFMLASLFILFGLSPGIAQSKQPVGLFADAVNYNPDTMILKAAGNVRIVSDGQILSAREVVFDQRTNRLTIADGFVITNADGSILTGDNAVLSADLSRNIIRGARLLIANQFQLAADQAQYVENRFKVLNRVVASTCYICEANPIPFWQIRANRVIHDEQEKQLYFENAWLEVLGVPVFYAPVLRLPDPTVDRASGFLVPSFLTSSLLNFGVRIPYFIAIDDHSDATVTAFISSVESLVFEGQYRRETQKGRYQFDGSLLLIDGVEGNAFRSSLTGDGRFEISHDYEWGFTLDVVSDKTFRAQYDYNNEDLISTQDRLFELFIERNRQNSFLNASASIIQSLRTTEVDAEIPLVFPDIYYRGILDDPLLGGKLGFTANSTTLLRDGSSRFTRLAGIVDWQRDFQMRNGLIIGARGQLDGEYYTLSDNYTGFTGSTASRITPTLSTDIRLPMAKVTKSATHVFEPIMQLVWNDDSVATTPNEDSGQLEFEETNLFSTNRFPGFDQKEVGLRANIGFNYSRYDNSGWKFNATAGRVFREQDLDQFTGISGLDRKNSDWVTAFNIQFPNAFEITNRTLFDSHFDLSKNETSLGFTYKDLQGDATYLWLEKDAFTDKRNEIELDLVYTANDNWSYLAQWRHDFVTQGPIEGEFGIKYANECVEIDLSLSLQYAASGNISETKELGLRVALIGIGNQARAERRRKSCTF